MKRAERPIPRRWIVGTAAGIALSLILSGIGFYRTLHCGTIIGREWNVESAQLKTIHHKEFVNQEVELDGKHFEDCSFYGVSLVFQGDASIRYFAQSLYRSVAFQDG